MNSGNMAAQCPVVKTVGLFLFVHDVIALPLSYFGFLGKQRQTRKF
jgi:hypothetical protein